MIHRNLRALFERLLILPALVLCIGSPGAFAATIGDIGMTVHVSGSGSDKTGDGSAENPWRTITHAFEVDGAYGPVIEVGAGEYDSAAGEIFPINIDSAGTHGFTLRGPGDGSAVVTITDYGYYDEGNMMESMVPMNGAILIESLDFVGVGTSSGTSPLGDSPSYGDGMIIDLNDDGDRDLILPANVELLEMRNVNANRIGLVDAHWMQNGVVSVYNNTAIQAESAVHIWMETASIYSEAQEGEPTTLSFSANVYDNVVSSCETGIGFDVDVMTWTPTSFMVSAHNNTIRNCEEGMNYETELTASSAQLDATVSFKENEVVNCDIGLLVEASYYGSAYGVNAAPGGDPAIVHRELLIEGNTFSGPLTNTGSSGKGFLGKGESMWAPCIEIQVEIGDYAEVVDDITIQGNNITGGTNGVFIRGDHEGSYGNYDRSLAILWNEVQQAIWSGINVDFKNWASDRGLQAASAALELQVRNNTIHHNSYGGLYVNNNHTTGGTMDLSVRDVISQNHIFANGGYGLMHWNRLRGLELDYDAELRGNVFSGNGGGAGDVDPLGGPEHRQVLWSFWPGNGDFASGDLGLDWGSQEAMGYNTISPLDIGESTSSTTIEFTARDTAPSMSLDVSAVGNWWGTQDAGAIEGRVLHGADETTYPNATADLSLPLPNHLGFQAEFVEGVGVVATAGAEAGFVPSAGNLLLEGSITGPDGYSEGGPIDASWVSEDYQTLVVPEDIFDDAPEGDYEICLTNPGGQTGCASFTIRDCSQNQIPTAVSEDADTFGDTPVTVDVTANDWDPNGNLDPTNVEILDTPDKGGAIVNADGSITYTPNAGMVDDSDSMTYVVYDTCGAPSNAATLHVRIGGAGTGGGDGGNQIPTANYDEVVTEQDAAVTVDILANDEDANGDALLPGSVTIIDTPGKGSATVNADGTVTYTPSPGVVATTDTFTYTVQDEHGATSNAATVGVMINFITESEEVTGGVGGNSGRTGTPGTRGGGLGNTGTVNHGTRTP